MLLLDTRVLNIYYYYYYYKLSNSSPLELTLSDSLEVDVTVEESDLGVLYSWLKSSWTFALKEKQTKKLM